MTKTEYPDKNGKNEKKKKFLFLWHKNRRQSLDYQIWLKILSWEWNFSILTFQNKKKDSEIFHSQSSWTEWPLVLFQRHLTHACICASNSDVCLIFSLLLPRHTLSINGARLGRLGQPEADQVESHSHAPHVYNRHAHNDSVPVECPRGPLLMCVTTGTYVVGTVRTVFLLLYPCRYVHYLRSIVKLRLIDTSTTVILHFATTHPYSNNTTHPQTYCMSCKIFCRRKTRLPDSQKLRMYDSPTERASCKIFADAKHARLPSIIKNYDSPTERTFCEHFTQRKMRHAYYCSSNRGPLADFCRCETRLPYKAIPYDACGVQNIVLLYADLCKCIIFCPLRCIRVQIPVTFLFVLCTWNDLYVYRRQIRGVLLSSACIQMFTYKYFCA